MSTLFGKAMRRYRRERGLTQTTLAKAVGVSQPYLAGTERGVRPLSHKVFQAVVEVFGLDAVATERLRVLEISSRVIITLHMSDLTPAERGLLSAVVRKVSSLSLQDMDNIYAILKVKPGVG